MAKYLLKFSRWERGEIIPELQWPDFEEKWMEVTAEGTNRSRVIREAAHRLQTEFGGRWDFRHLERTDKEAQVDHVPQPHHTYLPLVDTDFTLIRAVRKWIQNRFEGLPVDWDRYKRRYVTLGHAFVTREDFFWWDGDDDILAYLIAVNTAVKGEFTEEELEFWTYVKSGYRPRYIFVDTIKTVLKGYWEAYPNGD